MSKKLSIKDFDGFIVKHLLACKYERDKNRMLQMYVDPIKKLIWFVVTDEKDNRIQVLDLDKAIELYNDKE